MQVTLDDTTVGDLSGVRVGCGNFWEREFDGDKVMSARLAPFDGDDVTVREGTEVTVGGDRWRVVRLDVPEDGTASIVLERCD